MMAVDVIWVIGAVILLIASMVHLSGQLEKTRSEIDKLRQETFRANDLLVKVLLAKPYPEISQPEVYIIETEEERVRSSSLGQMLELAKERAQEEARP